VKKVNRILALKNDAGDKISDEQRMCQVATDYFKNLFVQNNSVRTPVIDAISIMIT